MGCKLPCRKESCRYNLREMYKEGQEVTYTCVLEVVDKNPDGMSLSEIGAIFGVSPQAIHDVSSRAISKIEGSEVMQRWKE